MRCNILLNAADDAKWNRRGALGGVGRMKWSLTEDCMAHRFRRFDEVGQILSIIIIVIIH